MWCWIRMEKINVTNKKVLHRVKKKRNFLRTVKRRNANWIGHILHKICLLNHIIEEKLEEAIEATGRQGWRSKQLPDDLNETRGYYKLEEQY
jgi:hypothetical protein